MKVFALCLLFVTLAFAADSNNATCANPNTDTTPTVAAGCVTVDEINAWAEISVNNTQPGCATFTYDAEDNNSLFVIAVRPGPDATGDVTLFTTQAATAEKDGSFIDGTCVQIQSGQEDDDFDYTCVTSPYTNSTTSVTVYSVAGANVTATTTVFEVYAGFAEGTTGDCTSSLVSSGGFPWIWVIVGVLVALALVVVLAAVGGFVYMKKKKSSYQLYDDA